MQKKLGQILIQAGLLTPGQLEEALKSQVIFGGRLGTNLMELGYLDENQITRFLSEKLGVPAADSSQISAIPPQVLGLVRPETVKKYQAIPISLDKKRLTVAMTDPSDLAAIDNLAFITGCIIVPVILPELRLIQAMERLYGIKREQRYISVSRELREASRKSQMNKSSKISDEQAEATNWDTFNPGPMASADFQGFDKYNAEAAWQHPEEPSPAETPTGDDQYSLDTLSSALAEADSREAIAESIIGYLGHSFAQAALFLIKGQKAIGWLASERGKMVDGIADLQLDLEQVPTLNKVVTKQNFFAGQLGNGDAEALESALGTDLAPLALLVPIVMLNRTVAVIYVGDTLESITRSVPVLQKLAVKASLSLEILILRNKILMM